MIDCLICMFCAISSHGLDKKLKYIHFEQRFDYVKSTKMYFFQQFMLLRFIVRLNDIKLKKCVSDIVYQTKICLNQHNIQIQTFKNVIKTILLFAEK